MSTRRMGLLLGLILFLVGLAWAESPTRPRYICFNMIPELDTDQTKPETFTTEKLAAVIRAIQPPDNPGLKIGVSNVFSILNCPDAELPVLEASLRNFLKASQAARVPIIVTLDTSNWWQARPELWNWWDPAQPGYNPENVYNVEWAGWEPARAVKICWRNWAQQMRVVPAPNLASPKVIDETLKRLRIFVPIIADWYRQLPADQKYLLGGVKIGQEVGISYNAYYYPRGNEFLEKWPTDPSHDPQTSLCPDLGFPCGVAPLGYAALKTSGIKTHGSIDVNDIALVVQQYLARLSRVTHELGLPRELIFAHSGGTYAPFDQNLPYSAAFNKWSTPSWSFYFLGPAEAGDVGGYLKRAGRKRWAAAEWWWGGDTQEKWEACFEQTLRFEDCRFICVYNWDVFRKDPNGLAAARALAGRWKETPPQGCGRRLLSRFSPRKDVQPKP